MKVLQLGKFYFPVVGGIETALKDICESLADEVQVQVLVANDRLRTEQEQGRIAVTRVASAGKFFSCSMAPSYPYWARKFHADLIHVHLANPLAELSALLADRDIPVVAHFHSDVVRPVPATSARRLQPLPARLLPPCRLHRSANPAAHRYLRFRSLLSGQVPGGSFRHSTFTLRTGRCRT